jgi:hypothetical protein
MSNSRKTRPWPELVEFYRRSAQDQALPIAPMVALVEFLASSRYGNALFASASEEALWIARVPDFEAGNGELAIRFDGNRQRFEFTHRQRADELQPWTRECGPDEWRHVLERILHQRLQWFHEG